MANNQKDASSSKERKISDRRLKNLQKKTGRTERRLSTLLERANTVEKLIDSPEQNGKRKLVLVKEHIFSETSRLNAALDRLSRTHSEYLAKNQRLDQEGKGLE